MNKIYFKRGYTILEAALVVSIFAFLSGALAFLVFYFNRVFWYERTLVGTSGDAAFIVADVENYAQVADKILATTTINGATYMSSSTALVLELPSLDSTNNIVSGHYDYIAIYKSGTELRHTLQADAQSARTTATKILSSSINDLTFTFNNASVTQATTTTVDVTTSGTDVHETLTKRLHQIVYLRNHS